MQARYAQFIFNLTFARFDLKGKEKRKLIFWFLYFWLQGRQAINWVISKIDEELKDLSSSAVKSTDEFIHHTKKSIGDISVSAKKSMDDLSSVAKKSLDELLPNTSPSGPQAMPKF